MDPKPNKKSRVETANTILHLPNDIIFNIFQRLSAEDLHELSCACKSFSNLIKTPPFIEAHLRNSTHGYGLICIEPAGLCLPHRITKTLHPKIQIRGCPVPSPHATVWATCNGLILFSTYLGRWEILLGNPVTKEAIKLPCPVHSAYYPLLGMTYIASTRKYTLVYYFTESRDKRSHSHGCEILTIGEDDAWRTLNCPRTNWDVPVRGQKMIFINDVAHWNNIEFRNGRENCVYHVSSLHMVTEKLYESEFPGDFRLLDICGVLSIMHPPKNCSTQFDIWSLRDIANGDWVVTQRIDVGIVSAYPLTTLNHGRVIILKTYAQKYKYPNFSYDIQLKQTTDLSFRSPKGATLLPHTDSLVSCKRKNV